MFPNRNDTCVLFCSHLPERLIRIIVHLFTQVVRNESCEFERELEV